MHISKITMIIMHTDIHFKCTHSYTITAAEVVPCGGPKKSPVHHPYGRLYFSFGSLRSLTIFRVSKTRLETYF